MVSRASAVGCHPSREIPLPVNGGVDPSVACRSERYFLLGSGQGHCSHPQPVHTSRITHHYRRSRARLRASATSRPVATYAAVPFLLREFTNPRPSFSLCVGLGPLRGRPV